MLTESNVLKAANGATITPQLHHYLSKKDGGHHVLIRVTKDKKHEYLDTSIYVLPKAFDAKTKGLKKADQQLELRRLLLEALKIVEGEWYHTVKEGWDYFRKGDKTHDWMTEVASHMEEDSLEKLVVKRGELEAQLGAVNDLIQQLSRSTGREMVKSSPSAQDVSDYNDAMALYLNSLKGKSERDQQMFTSWKKVLEECAAAKKFKLSLNVFDMDFYWSYANFILYQRGCFNNTFGAHVKKLKMFLNYAEKKGYKVNQGFKDKDFKILEETKTVVYLTDNEIDLLWNMRKDFPQHSDVIDLCVFQNLVGLRIGDVMQHHIIVEEDGKEFLTNTTEKTEGTYMIPLSLDERIRELLTKHDNDMRFLTEAEYNREIKVVVSNMYEHYKLKEPVIAYKRYKLGESTPFTKPKSELLSSHSNRRGFITRNVNGGIFNETDILQIIGSKDYTTLKKYIKIESDSLDEKAQAARQKKQHRRQQAALS